MMTQKDAVFNTVKSVLNEAGKSIDGQVVLTDDERKACLAVLTTTMQQGEILVSEAKQAKMTTEKDYRDYSANILNNWVRKDKRLNGDTTYVPKNPGSRAGAGDDQVKELKKLKSTLSDPEAQAEVQAAIDERIAELRAERNQAKVEDIKIDAIPEHLRHLVLV